MKTTILSIILTFFILHIYGHNVLYLKTGKTKTITIIDTNKTTIKYRIDSITKNDSVINIKLSRIMNFNCNKRTIDLLNPQNHRKINRFGVYTYSTNAMLYSNIGVGFDYLLSKNISAEVNIGGFNNRNVEYLYSGGLKYWPIGINTKNMIYPFVGLSYGKAGLIYYIDETDWKTKYYHTHVHEPYLQSEIDYYDLVEIPVGLSYITKFGLQVSAQYDFTLFMDWRKYYWPNLAIKLGWRF